MVRKGVEVIVWKHEQTWVAPLLEAAEAAANVHSLELAGRIGLTRDEAALEGLRRRIFANLVP